MAKPEPRGHTCLSPLDWCKVLQPFDTPAWHIVGTEVPKVNMQLVLPLRDVVLDIQAFTLQRVGSWLSRIIGHCHPGC